MKHIVGAWSWWETFLYDLLITPRLRPLYELFADHTAACFTGGPILEVGCGSALAATIMADRYPGSPVTATDLSDAQLNRARRRVRGNGSAAVTVAKEDACNLSFADDTYALVYSLASIKHWPDQIAGLREAHRVTAPGGHTMILEVDREAPDDEVERFIEMWRAPGFMRPEHFFRTTVLPFGLSNQSALDLCAEAGIADPAIFKPDGLPFLYIQAKKPGGTV